MLECLHFDVVLLLDLTKNHQTCPAVTMQEMHMHSNWKKRLIVLGQRVAHSFPCCIGLFCPFEFLSTGPLIGISVIFAEFAQRQDCRRVLRGFVPSRRGACRGRFRLLPHVFALPRWSGHSNSSSSTFRSFLLSMCVDAPKSPANYHSSGFFEDGAGSDQNF